MVFKAIINNDKAIYKSIVTNRCGSDSINFRVTVNPLPAIDLGEDIVINEGVTTILDAGEWESYSWKNK